MRTCRHIVFMIVWLGAIAASVSAANLTSTEAASYLLQPPATISGQSATLLPDGTWLLLGGEVNGKIIGAAIIENPTTGTRTTLPATLNVARTWHTATVLPNGQVFIFGGMGANGKLVSQAEYFDPTTQSFSLASPTGLTPRSHHTANVLTNGLVLLAGGAEFAPAELWDPRTNEVTPAVNSMLVPRTDALSTLLATSPVLIWGGTDVTGAPVSSAELYVPSLDQFAPAESGSVLLPPPPDQTAAPQVAESQPGDGDKDVSVSALIAVRFSGRLEVASLNSSTVTLIGPAGQVTAKVVPAEQGMLLFVTPAQELLPASYYTLFIRGTSDPQGNALAPFTLGFETAALSAGAATGVPTSSGATGTISVVESPLPFGVGVWQPPSASYGNNWLMGPATKTTQANIPMLMAAPGITALAGQVLLQNGAPLPGVAVSIGNQHTVTDTAGRFLVQNIPAGHVVFIVNGRTANTAAVQFGQFVLGADIQSNITNTLSYTVWMPVIDTAHAVNIPSPTTQEVNVTSPLLPGVILKIPAGTVIREPNGNIVTQVSLTPVPTDRSPVPMPTSTSIYFVIQPGGATLESVTGDSNLGAQLIYPNVHRRPAGTPVKFWYYDPYNSGWMIYGHGKVSADSSKFVPDKEVRLPAFTPFYAGHSGYVPPPPAMNPPICGCLGGDPVDLYTGAFTYSHVDMVLPDTIPIVIRRTYQSSDTQARQFGIGWSEDYASYLYDPLGPDDNNFSVLTLVLPNGSTIVYTRIASSPQTGLTGLQMTASNTPSGFYGSTITFDGSRYLLLTLKDGTVYKYDNGNGRYLGGITNRNGQSVLFTLSAPSYLSTVTGQPVANLQSPNGRWMSFTYASGAYDPGYCCEITSLTDNSGRVFHYAYNSNADLTSVTYPDGGVEQYTYNSGGQLQSIVLPNGQTMVSNVYDGNGRVVQQTYADGGIETFQYLTNSQNQVIETIITDPKGVLATLQFNSSGYVVSDSRASGTSAAETTTFTRDPASNLVTSTTDAMGRTSNFGYNPMGDLTSMTLLVGTSSAITYYYTYTPNFNELNTFTDPLNDTTTFGYDSNGNLNSITDGLGHQIVTATYNSLGLPITVTNALNNITTFNYGGNNEIASDLTSVTDPLGRTTFHSFDTIGRLMNVMRPAGDQTNYVYDPMNRVLQVMDALGNVTAMSYDYDGNLVTVTDANDHTSHFSYDVKDRLFSRTDALNQTETFNYDLDSNLIAHTDRKGQSQALAYDALNRFTQVTYKNVGGSTESTVSYGYDAGNRVTSITDSVGGTLTEGYDGLDRLTSETSPNGSVSYQYDAADRRTQMAVAGQMAVIYGYDNANRLTGITQGSQSVAIGYDNANRRTTLTLPNGIQLTYGFDNANELTGLTYKLGASTVGTMTYGYDNDGRIVNRGGTLDVTNLPAALASASYDANNRLTNWGGQTLSYDADGNLTGDGTNTYTWNTRNQLMSLSGGSTASFVYDALGRRETKTISSTATNFLYDGLNLEQELSGSTPTVNYLTGAGIDESLSRTDSSGTESYLTDNLDSTLALTSSAGAISTSYSYEPYGNTTVTGTTSTNALQYTGRENDGDGLYYFRARYYSPQYSRFISEDPIGFSGGINAYEYVLDSPMLGFDPLGLVDINLIVPDIQKAPLEADEHAGDEADIAATPNGDKYIDAQQIVSPDNTITIAAEGSPNGDLVNQNAVFIGDLTNEYYSAQQIANMIRQLPGYQGKTIMIIACDAGSSTSNNSFAQQLANMMGALVIAPDSFIIPDGYGGYTFPSTGGGWVPYYPMR